MRVLEKLVFCVEIKSRHWDSPCCVHRLPAWWTYGTYSGFCKLHMTSFCSIPYAASQQKRCVAVTLPFSVSPSFTPHIDKGQQHVNGHDAPGSAPGNLERRADYWRTAEEGLLIEPGWSPPSVLSPGTLGWGTSYSLGFSFTAWRECFSLWPLLENAREDISGFYLKYFWHLFLYEK